MNTTRRFLLPLLALALSPLSAAVISAADAAGAYNVLVLMSDEHNPRILGCYGDPLVKTPNLDSLAATGVRFTAAYCQNPICVPSRVSLVSGRMPSNLNTFGNMAKSTSTTCRPIPGRKRIWSGIRNSGKLRTS